MDLDTLSLISFFSLAKVEKFDITPIEKTMKIFDKIKKIFLIGTRESISSAKQYKNKLEEKFRNISVKIFEIETGDYEEVYNLLRVIIGENLLEKSNILIDNTLGNKMTGAVFYRFGVEQGVKLITWQNEQIKNIDDFALRIPGTEKFNFVKEPEFFNYNTYRNIDYLLEKYKFEEAKMLFEQMNNYDMVLICKAFSKIYCYETLSSIYGIFDEIDEFIKVFDEAIKNNQKSASEYFDEICGDYQRRIVTKTETIPPYTLTHLGASHIYFGYFNYMLERTSKDETVIMLVKNKKDDEQHSHHPF